MISWLKQLRLGYRAPGWSALLTGQGVAGQTTREQPVCPRRSLADLPTTGPVSFDLSSVTCRRSTRLWVFLAANYKGTKMPAIRGICQFCAEASSARGTTTCQPCVYAIMEYREDGVGAKEVALEFGVTKNVIIGLWNRHKGPNAPRHKSAAAPSTTFRGPSGMRWLARRGHRLPLSARWKTGLTHAIMAYTDANGRSATSAKIYDSANSRKKTTDTAHTTSQRPAAHQRSYQRDNAEKQTERRGK